MFKYFCFTVLLIFPAFLCAQKNAADPLRLSRGNVRQIVAAMTLEEKAALVIGTGMRFHAHGAVIGEADGKVPGAAGNSMNISRLGIPGTVLADGPAGLRIDPKRGEDSLTTFYATWWPSSTLVASSWDTTLINRLGVAFGNEVKEYGVDYILGPGMNIQRDPLGGRNFEYYSEDPLLSGSMAAGIINGIQSNGVGVSAKHFAANNQESNRNYVDVIASERALREIYLRGFEIMLRKSQPWTVMSSYNKINGTYTSESHDLLTKILRNEWGYKGFVVTDWMSGSDVVKQIQAGNDLIMPGNRRQSKTIVEAVKSGGLKIETLDLNVERILNVVLKTPAFFQYRYNNQPDLKAHADLARRIAAESIILLKNKDNVLPLRSGTTVALFGNASYEMFVGGTGSGQVNSAYTTSLLQGLESFSHKNEPELTASYWEYIQQDKLNNRPKVKLSLSKPYVMPELTLSTNAVDLAAAHADVAIFTIGRNSGEGADRKVEGNFNLSETEQLLLKKVSDAFHSKGKKLIVIINSGGGN